MASWGSLHAVALILTVALFTVIWLAARFQCRRAKSTRDPWERSTRITGGEAATRQAGPRPAADSLGKQGVDESERRYRSLIQTLPAPVLVHHVDGSIVASNEAARDLLGAVKSELHGRRMADLACRLLDADGQPMDRAAYPARRALTTEGPVRDLIVGIQHPTDSLRWAACNADPVFDDQANIAGAVITFLDITARKRAEESLRRRTHQLALLNQVSRTFSSSLDLGEVLGTILDGMRELLQVTGGSVWLHDSETGELVCRQAVGPGREEVCRWRLAPGEGLAGWTASRGESLIVQDAAADDRHVGTLGEQIGLALRSVASVPLQVKGMVIGTLQAVDTEPGRFGPDDLNLLEPLAASAAVAIENAHLYRQARDEIDERRRTQEALEASLREKESLLQEIHHRVKNNLQVMTSLLRLQSQFAGDPEIQQALAKSRDRLQSMALVHEHLYRSPDLARINLADYLQRYVPYLTRVYNAQAQRVRVTIEADATFLNIDGAVPCGLLVNELVSNALKHGFPGERTGEIRVELRTHTEHTELTVSDDGVGLPTEVDLDSAESLGLQLVNTLVKQLGGSVDVDSRQGTAFAVTFPTP